MRSHSMAAPLVSLLAFAFVFSGCASTQSPQEEVVVTSQPAAVVTTEGAAVALPTELVTIHPALLKAWQGTDPAALQVYFTDAAIVVTPDAKYTGWADINTRWVTPMLPVMSNFIATPTSFTREGADIIEAGTYSFKVTKQGDTDDIEGTYTQRWQRQADGTWRLVSISVTETDD